MSRVGKVDADGKIIVWPTEYADGVGFSKGDSHTMAMYDESHFLLFRPGDAAFISVVARAAIDEEVAALEASLVPPPKESTPPEPEVLKTKKKEQPKSEGEV